MPESTKTKLPTFDIDSPQATSTRRWILLPINQNPATTSEAINFFPPTKSQIPIKQSHERVALSSQREILKRA
jgi:hypothetical protein